MGSPASGECETAGRNVKNESSFQFIGFPSEWGAPLLATLIPAALSLFPIYWVPQRVGRADERLAVGFSKEVSNLLGSPASGESTVMMRCFWLSRWSFPIYWVPQRVGSYGETAANAESQCVSNLLGSPASGEDL